MSSRIICITGMFYDTDKFGHRVGQPRFCVSHGIEEDTDRVVVMSSEHPTELGTVFDQEIGEWVIPALTTKEPQK